MTSELDISNVINVSLQDVPSGLQETNVNSLALFTNEIPSNVDNYRIYTNSRDVGTDYGTESETKKMADAIFSQSPNILSGNGRLVIIPMVASVKATNETLETPDISLNLANFQAVSDGEFNISVDGNAFDVLALDFTNAVDLQDVVDIMQKKLINVKVELISDIDIKFSSKKVGTVSEITIISAGGSGTDITVASLLNITGASTTAGINSSGETLLEAIARIENEIQFTGVITNLEIEDAVIETTSNSIQSTKYIWVQQFVSFEDLEGVCKTIKDAGNNRTRCLLYSIGLVEANLMKSCYVGRAFSVNFSGSNTTQTLNLKELKTIISDPNMSQTLLTKAKDNGVDLYVSYAGVPSIVSNGENDYFDFVYNNVWLKNALEVAGFNYLRQTNTKIPQVESGMDGLKNAYSQVCERAIRNRMIGLGLAWNSSETFGNPEDLKRNITDKGYYIYSLAISQQPQTERDNRIAPLIQMAIKLAGAIHKSDVLVVIEK